MEKIVKIAINVKKIKKNIEKSSNNYLLINHYKKS